MLARHIRVAFLLAVALVPRSAAACSVEGPDVHEFYASLARPEYSLGSVAATVALIWLVVGRRHPRYGLYAVVLVALGVFHPAWMVSAENGDCGMSRLMTSRLVNEISVSTLAVGLIHTFVFTRRAAARAPGA